MPAITALLLNIAGYCGVPTAVTNVIRGLAADLAMLSNPDIAKQNVEMDQHWRTTSKLPRAKGAMSAASCDHCGSVPVKGEKLMRCSKCKVAWYCSKDHQMQAWPEHKKTCFVVKDS